MNTGFSGLLRSKICVMRFDRQAGKGGTAVARLVPSETRYAMPVLHSQKLLCVSPRLATTVFTSDGLAGLVTSYTSCELAVARKRYCLARLARGSSAPLHARTICAPPASPSPDGPGMCFRYTGRFGSVTSMIEVPLA